MSIVPAFNNHSSTDNFDHSVIDSLKNVMPVPAVLDLLGDVERDIRLRLERLEELNVASASLGVIAQDAHDLKSIGGNFGLNVLSAQAGKVERAARNGCVDTVREALPALISTGLNSVGAISAYAVDSAERAI